jgi:phage-related tail fiber protein
MACEALTTTVGTAAIAAARAAMTPLSIAEIAVGDGGGSPITPDVGDTALTNEVWRGSVLVVDVDPTSPDLVRISGAVPPDEGGWTIREAGVFNAAGDLIAIASTPAVYKPAPGEGGEGVTYIRLVVPVIDAVDAVAEEDHNVVIATKHYVQQQVGSLLHPLYS